MGPSLPCSTTLNSELYDLLFPKYRQKCVYTSKCRRPKASQGKLLGTRFKSFGVYWYLFFAYINFDHILGGRIRKSTNEDQGSARQVAEENTEVHQ